MWGAGRHAGVGGHTEVDRHAGLSLQVPQIRANPEWDSSSMQAVDPEEEIIDWQDLDVSEASLVGVLP